MNESPMKKITRAIDALIDAGDKYEGLFPSLLAPKTRLMLQDLPTPIKGQSKGDRSHLGSNLMHDEPTLLTMYGLAEALGRREYAAAADRYLQRFATHCTDTETGLFPWGEHAFWHLVLDQVGNSSLLHNPDTTELPIHDHLRQAPLWLWQKLYEFNPRCVERFGEGLDYHWAEGEPREYCRHAEIVVKARPQRGARSCDFPRHGGFYIYDWAFATVHCGRSDFLDQIRLMTDYWWVHRDANGVLLGETRSPEQARDFFDVLAPGQTLSLGVSLLEAADMLANSNPELAARMRERGTVYIDGFLSSPHDLDAGCYVLAYNRHTREVVHRMPVWGSVYGIWPASYLALTCLCANKLTSDERLYNWAASVGERYATEPMPEEIAVPAMDVGLALGLLADLYEISGERKWMDAGLALADTALSIYFKEDLPVGAAGIDWYKSQMGPGFLLHGLARIELLNASRDNCPLKADYTAR